MKTAHCHIRVAWSAEVRFIRGVRSSRLHSGGRLACLRAGPPARRDNRHYQLLRRRTCPRLSVPYARSGRRDGCRQLALSL